MKRVLKKLSYLNNFAKMLRDARFRQHRLNSKKNNVKEMQLISENPVENNGISQRLWVFKGSIGFSVFLIGMSALTFLKIGVLTRRQK